MTRLKVGLTVRKTKNLFQRICYMKNEFISSTKLDYFGFIINSDRILTYFSHQKKTKIYYEYRIISKVTDLKIRGIESLTLTLTFQAKKMDHCVIDPKNKDDFLKVKKENYNAKMKRISNAFQELKQRKNKFCLCF